MKKLILATILITSFSSFANAGIVRHVTETFASGAVFDGDVTFTNSFDNVTAVDGLLTGGGYGTDHINWIWNPAANFSGTPTTGGNFLMGGSPAAYKNYVTFTWNYSAAPSLTFSNVGYGNNINNTDAATGGTISSISAVPEPESYTMVLAGLGLMGFMLRRRKTS